MVWRVHVVGILLSLRTLCSGVLVHLHVRIRSVLGRLGLLLLRNGLLLLLLTLSAHALISLLLLNARCWGSARAGLESHWGYERPSELGLSDERMQLGLCRGPTF